MTDVPKRVIPFSQPALDGDELTAVRDVLSSGWITTGPKTKEFEERFASFIGAPAALAVFSATDAMQIGLASVGIRRGDAVITTPMTFCSTVHVIEHLGAHPILVDIEPDTLNVDHKEIAKALEGAGREGSDAGQHRIRAIMPVHLYGHPCEMDAILEIARSYNLPVIEDAAHALPAQYKGRMVGTIGTLTAFSFYATKNLTTAEGGMLTGSPDLINQARVWSLHGMSRDAWKRYSAEGSWYYEVILPGFKCNMTDIQAAIGLQQLRKLPQFQARRLEIVRCYNNAFTELAELQVPTVRPGVEHAWHLYVVRLNLEMLAIDRARFIEELRIRNIGTSVHFIPIHLHPYYRDKYGYKPDDFPVAYREFQRIISLPLYPKMTDQDVEDVIEAVFDVVRKFRR